MPDSGRSEWVALHISVGSNSSSVTYDSLLFVWFISLVISAQWDSDNLVLSTAVGHFLFASKCSSWVSDICAEHFVSHNQDAHTSGPRESQINAWVRIQSSANCVEWFIKLLFYFCWIDYSLVYFGLIKSVFDILFDLLCKECFTKVTDKFTIDAVAITHSKEVCSSVFTKMGQHKETVLILLIRVFRRISRFSCKCKLGDAVVELFAWLTWLHRWILNSCSYFFWNWRSHVVLGVLGVVGVVLGFWGSWQEVSFLILTSRRRSILNPWAIGILNFVQFIKFTHFSLSSLSWNVACTWLSSAVVALTLVHSVIWVIFISFLLSQWSHLSFLLFWGSLSFELLSVVSLDGVECFFFIVFNCVILILEVLLVNLLIGSEVSVFAL